MNSKILTKTPISKPEVGIQSRCLAVLSVFCAFVFVNSEIRSSMDEVMNRLRLARLSPPRGAGWEPDNNGLFLSELRRVTNPTIRSQRRLLTIFIERCATVTTIIEVTEPFQGQDTASSPHDLYTSVPKFYR